MYMCYLGIGAVLYFLLASSGTASVAWFVLLTGITCRSTAVASRRCRPT
jgi:hypothetical protein